MNKRIIKLLIEEYKKANKDRREKIGIKAGFPTGAAYLADLESQLNTKNKPSSQKQALITVNKKEEKIAPVTEKKGIFYVVDVLDASGSMQGSKYENSKKGIIDGIKDLTARNDLKYSLVEFVDSSTSLNKSIIQADPKDVKTGEIKFAGAIGNDTPLYSTVYEVINDLKVNPEDKVLINVYTDGGDNGRKSSSIITQNAAKLIEKVKKENFTITFVATPADLERIKRDISIDDSNTLATENTALGFKMSMEKTRVAKAAYFSKADAGQSVLTGFYKSEGTL